MDNKRLMYRGRSKKMLNIKRIINQPITSNCFIIYSDKLSDCIVIDPGTFDNKNLIVYLQDYNLSPKYIILTHQHFDHIWGINNLREHFVMVKTVCNEICAELIKNSKDNCSLFYDQKGFGVLKADLITEKINNCVKYDDYLIEFYNTPGHSPASICIKIGNNLFTGDTLIQNEKTVIKLPKGSRQDLMQTMAFLNTLKGLNLIVYPGHGEIFELDKYDIQRSI
jgi:glyoxylase-like metal-dependent hydrolase (beta-lactamase superfamily II)